MVNIFKTIVQTGGSAVLELPITNAGPSLAVYLDEVDDLIEHSSTKTTTLLHKKLNNTSRGTSLVIFANTDFEIKTRLLRQNTIECLTNIALMIVGYDTNRKQHILRNLIRNFSF